MTKPKILFHGSDKEIKNFIFPQKATDETSSENCQLGVYATDRIEVAKEMSLVGKNHAYANFSEKDFKVLCSTNFFCIFN